MLQMCFKCFTTNCQNSCKHIINTAKKLQTAGKYITNNCKHTSNALAKHAECFKCASTAFRKTVQSGYQCATHASVKHATCFKCASNALQNSA